MLSPMWRGEDGGDASPPGGGGQGAGHDLAPDLEVVLRVADDGGFAPRARGGMEAAHLGEGDREEAEGVVLAEVGLHREGDPLEVVEAPDGLGRDPRRGERLPVEGDALARPLEALPEASELEGRQLLAGKGLG